MKNLRNNVRLFGNLGQDPIVQEINGTAMATFSIATSSMHKGTDGKKVLDLQWHRIVVWGKLAEQTGTFIKRGSYVVVEGRLKYHSVNEQGGIVQQVTEIHVQDIRLAGARKSTTLLAA